MRAALLLDRDGTLIVDRGYLGEPSGVELLPGVLPALRRAHDAGFALIVVTNQSGVGRGFFSLEQVKAVHERLDELLAASGVPIEGYYVCPHSPPAPGVRGCSCRKPRPGLLLQAATERELCLADSWMIGDKCSDAQAGLSAGAGSFWIGETAPPKSSQFGYPSHGEYAVAADLPAAVDWILKHSRRG